MTAKWKGAAKAAPIACSTCGTPRSLAAVVVAIPGSFAGPTFYLCDRCVKLAWDLVKAERKKIADRARFRRAKKED